MSIELLNLEGKLTVAEVAAKLNEVIEALNAAQTRDRGPKSDRTMTDEDARRILEGGDLEQKSHKEAAEILGLSYGQIYSARKGFTFKPIHKEIEKRKSEA